MKRVVLMIVIGMFLNLTLGVKIANACVYYDSRSLLDVSLCKEKSKVFGVQGIQARIDSNNDYSFLTFRIKSLYRNGKVQVATYTKRKTGVNVVGEIQYERKFDGNGSIQEHIDKIKRIIAIGKNHQKPMQVFDYNVQG